MKIAWVAALVAIIAAIAGISYTAGKRARPAESSLKPVYVSSHKLQSAINIGVTKVEYAKYLTEFDANLTMARAVAGVTQADFDNYMTPSYRPAQGGAVPPELAGPGERTKEKVVVLCYLAADVTAGDAVTLLDLAAVANRGWVPLKDLPAGMVEKYKLPVQPAYKSAYTFLTQPAHVLQYDSLPIILSATTKQLETCDQKALATGI